jgi:hypothetical protein
MGLAIREAQQEAILTGKKIIVTSLRDEWRLAGQFRQPRTPAIHIPGAASAGGPQFRDRPRFDKNALGKLEPWQFRDL